MKFISKAVKTTKGVASGIVDYSRKMKEVNVQASKNLAGTYGNSSTDNDAQRVATEMQRIKKERNISLKNSVRAKLGLQ